MSADDRWGCPDWRDIAVYPADPGALEDWEWKWEFLRRAPEYREEFSRFSGKENNNGSRYTIEDHFDHKWIFANYSLPEIIDPKLALTSCPFSDFGGTQVKFPSAFELMDDFEEGVSMGIGRLRFLYRTLLSLLQLEGITTDDDSSETLKKIVTVRFNLSKPLNAQLGAAKHNLQVEAEHLEAKFPKPKLYGKVRTGWPRHLRVIDAEDQGATDTEIFKQLHSELESDRDAYDDFGGEQPLAMIADWRKAARSTMEKAAFYL